MTLKTATTIALIGIFADLILSLIRWVLGVFDILIYTRDTIWISHTFWLIGILLSTIPIAIFLFALRQKQTGGGNG